MTDGRRSRLPGPMEGPGGERLAPASAAGRVLLLPVDHAEVPARLSAVGEGS